MKIIFESEEEKDNFVRVLANMYCPEDFGKRNPDKCIESCPECLLKALVAEIVTKEKEV